MKALMQLMPFDEAKEVARRNNHTVKPLSICGIKREDINWGHEVVIEFDDLGDRYYTCHHYVVPSCCFESHVTPLDSIYILRYGTILTDDELFDRCDEMASNVRVRVVSCQGNIYYIKMVNGETVEFRKLDGYELDS